jgi:tRNA pseudouridine55 synthase
MRHGFLLVDKPTGMTSHDVVDRVRKTLHEKDIGHLGTLDPAASGLLVLAVGSKGLKMIEYVSNLSKEYVADVRFGAVSSTYDAEGMIDPVEHKPGVALPAIEDIRRIILDRFTGSIDQVPPAHSAIHIAGQRAYELARKGQAVEMPVRKVDIDACEILSFDYPKLRLRVACGSGTYIRSLAHDLGHLLRCGGYLEALRRTKVGKWDIKDGAVLDKVQWTDVMPLKEVLKHFPRVDLTTEEAAKIRNGQRLPKVVQPGTIGWFEDLPIVVLFPYRDNASLAQPKKVL